MPIPPDSPYRSLLVDAIDFAGLFPPAAQDMSSAVRDYGRYRQGDEAWALGRFVVPVARLEEFDPQAAELVKLRYFAGFTQHQAAQLVQLNKRAADRLWSFARAFLLKEIQAAQGGGG